MRDSLSSHPPIDQAHGLRRLFAHARVKFLPVVSNPHMAFGGLMLERLTTAIAELGLHTLVVDASERAADHAELALMALGDCIEPLSAQVSYLVARGLPIRFVDAQGSTAPFLQAVADAAPQAEVVLLHAPASDLCRLFARGAETSGVCPLLLADDRPASVTHAYAALKLLTQRAGLVVHDLLLGAAPNSPRAERIAMQLATCADDFLGAALRDWVQLDPACAPTEAPTPALRRLVRETLRRPHDAAAAREAQPIESATGRSRADSTPAGGGLTHGGRPGGTFCTDRPLLRSTALQAAWALN